MIHDKDYIIRIVKQFSEFLSLKLLEKNEGQLPDEQIKIFETNMNDTFKMSFEALAEKSTDEIIQMVEAKDKSHQIPFFDLLGHLFYFKFKETQQKEFAEKAQQFYELFLQKSGIFSMPIIARISELKAL